MPALCPRPSAARSTTISSRSPLRCRHTESEPEASTVNPRRLSRSRRLASACASAAQTLCPWWLSP
eukprot:1050817-Prymnesium_polylepis.2